MQLIKQWASWLAFGHFSFSLFRFIRGSMYINISIYIYIFFFKAFINGQLRYVQLMLDGAAVQESWANDANGYSGAAQNAFLPGPGT